MSRLLPLYGDQTFQNGSPASAFAASADAELHLFRTLLGVHVFIVDGSRIYDIDPRSLPAFEELERDNVIRDNSILDSLKQNLSSPGRQRAISDTPLTPLPLYSLSLNVAQACNMSCHYCYADTGKFGGSTRMMDLKVGLQSVDRLIRESGTNESLLIGFMGGEPLLNREVIHGVTRYAVRKGSAAGKQIKFSITTNGTLLRPEDVKLFSEYPYSVQVSLDGNKSLTDALRPMKHGQSSYDRVIEALALFERFGRPKHLAARVTVTPKSGKLLPILDHIISLGFDEVGFAPVLVSPSREYAFKSDEFLVFLENMIACGKKALNELLAGRKYPFGNFLTAMRELHKGSHRPYPCGAGAAYLSVNAEGNLFACHRLIDDPKFAMGNIKGGSDLYARAEHLRRSHVDSQEPCRSCWARYLCGGGCYHEVQRRGRVACDYIRGWLDFCLKAYVELTSLLPQCLILNEQNENITDYLVAGALKESPFDGR